MKTTLYRSFSFSALAQFSGYVAVSATSCLASSNDWIDRGLGVLAGTIGGRLCVDSNTSERGICSVRRWL
jgi:hypothetical protein